MPALRTLPILDRKWLCSGYSIDSVATHTWLRLLLQAFVGVYKNKCLAAWGLL